MPERGMIGRTIDHYRIEQMLGQGGMAAVYKATDTQLQRDVAIKVMHPHLASQESFQQRFLQEARSAARLDHPNVVRVFSFDSNGVDLFLVMEYIPGGNLRQYVKRLSEDSQFIDYPEALEVMRQIAEGLDYAHLDGMIHRDMKPDNILLKPDSDGIRLNYRPIITDFGLARLVSDDESAITEQQPIGTYPYMSPEQCMAEELDNRTDIYSLGIMLYELTVGRLPFNPKSIAEAARMHGREALTLPSALRPGFPPDLEQIIIKSLSKDRKNRFATAGELAEALRALQKPIERTKVERRKPERRTIQPPPAPPSSDDTIATDLATDAMDDPLPLDRPMQTAPPSQDNQVDRLLMFRDGTVPQAIDLVKDAVIVGREKASCDIVLESPTVSRQHLRLERKPNGKYTITDLGAKNGIWMPDGRLPDRRPVILNEGTVVRVGDYWLQLELKPLPDEIATPLPPAVLEQPTEAPPSDGISEHVEPVSPVGIVMPPPPGMVPAAPSLTPPAPTEPQVTPGPEALVQTQAMSLSAIRKEMPRRTPPYVTADQIGYDRLVIFSEDKSTQVIRLDKEHYTIGRTRDQDIILTGRGVSRLHAEIERAIDGKFFIRDLGSKNGVYLNNERLQSGQAARLEPEKIVRLGEYWIQYELKRDLPSFAMPSAPDALADVLVDVNATVQMVKPLDSEPPPYTPASLTIEQRTSDRLVFLSEDHPMHVEKLDREQYRIGRDRDQDILLEGKRVSRRHALIELRREGETVNIYVTDQNSVNGVWMGDTLLVPLTEVLWDLNEILRIGNYWVKFERGDRNFDPFASMQQSDRYRRVGQLIKNFRVDRFIGEGYLAAVYKATQLPLDRSVAMKFLHPNLASQAVFKQRFLEEARKLSRITHPNVQRVLTYDSIEAEVFMVMELVTGGTLRGLLDQFKSKDRRMKLSQVSDLVTQMANGLHVAHQQGMVHRDLTPESVVLRRTAVIGAIENYQPVLTDFQVAQASESGEIFITDKPHENFPYMSPEQCRGERIDIRSDVYELGVILYEMVVGRPPYQPKSMADAIRMHVRERFDRPSELQADVPDDLEKVILRALEKDPNNRFQTADEFARALQRTQAGLETGGVRSGGLISNVGVERGKTAYMPEVAPKEMPFPTRAPFLDDDVQVDRLIIYSDNTPARPVPLKKNVFTIGRDKDQDIVLNSEKVSRRHARLEIGVGGVYRLIDLGSTNGTFLGNYKLVTEVAEIWDRTQTVRVGDFWLRIESAEDLDARAKSDEVPEKGAEPVEVARPVQLLPLVEEKITINLGASTVRVAPGSSVTLPVEIANRSDLVDHFKVEAIGLPLSWVTQPAQALYLLPQNRDTVSITFHPPMDSTSAAGAHAFEVRVTARAQGITSVASQGALVVEPFQNFVADLQPQKIRGRGRTELTIRNSGNTFGTYTIQARDREQLVSFDLEGRQYVLPPGHTEYVSLRMRAKKRPFFGAAQSYPFELTVTPAPSERSAAPQSLPGELVAPPIIPGWLIGGCLLLLLLCAIIGLLGYMQVSQFLAQTQTAVAIVATTTANFDATATAIADVDQDGLSQAQEVTLQSDPNLADTDEDGIPDGEEIRVWRTNPLNRDTDGDSLPDGAEVAAGLDPLNRDTDADGLPDNEDPNPSAKPTPTITPFPTIPGSQGDICPGSPSPSQITVGIQAFVTEGGVANRLRDKPSKREGTIIGYMAPGSPFIVVGGPVCDPDDLIRWWQVNFNGLEAWTAEGEGQEYYLAPAEGGAGGAGGAPASGDEESLDGTISDPPQIASVLRTDLTGIQVDWNVDAPQWQQLMSLTSPLRMGWLKFQVSWKGVEPQKGVLSGDFSRLQNYVQDAKSRGFRVLLSVAKAPDWARSNRAQDGPPDNPQELARFMSLLLGAIGANVDAIEVWNEPNLRREWTGLLGFNGRAYMDLFRPAYRAIREVSTSVVIITAGLAPTTDTAGSVNDRKFLRQMYQNGLADLSDVVIGVHPYGWGNAPDIRCCDTDPNRGFDERPQFFFLNTISTYRAIAVKAGHNVQLWTTEFGWAVWSDLAGTAPEPWMDFNTPELAADFTRRAFGIGQALDFMGPMFLWNLNFANDSTVNNRSDVAGFSLLFTDGANGIRTRSMYDNLVGRLQ